MPGFDILDQDSETEPNQAFDIQPYLDKYKTFIEDSKTKLSTLLETNQILDKKVAKTFLSMIDEGYDQMNKLSELMEFEVVENPEEITAKMDSLNNSLYVLMDQKFRDVLCSEEGFQWMNQKEYLKWVDVYYNFFAVSDHRPYLFTALEYSDLDLLLIADPFMEKNGKNNKTERYFTYLKILLKKYEKMKMLGVDQILEISNLNRLCSREIFIEETFRNFFKFKILN
jgi:hypothetical protein